MVGKTIVNKAVATALLMAGFSVVTPAVLAQSAVEQEDRYLINAYREKRAHCAAVQGEDRMQCYSDLALMQPKYKSAKARLKLSAAGARSGLKLVRRSS